MQFLVIENVLQVTVVRRHQVKIVAEHCEHGFCGGTWGKWKTREVNVCACFAFQRMELLSANELPGFVAYEASETLAVLDLKSRSIHADNEVLHMGGYYM